MRNAEKYLWIALAVLGLLGCSVDRPPESIGPASEQLTSEPKAASEFTRLANAAVLDLLPFEDESDFERASRGFVAGPDALVIPGDAGQVTWDMTVYDFIEGDAPDSVNPSLWRQAKLNGITGLFEKLEMAMSMTGLALSGRAENCGDVVVSFNISLLREIEIAAVGLRLTSKGVLQVLFGFSSQ